MSSKIPADATEMAAPDEPEPDGDEPEPEPEAESAAAPADDAVAAMLAVPAAAVGQRLDVWLTAHSPDYSRVQVKRMIEGGLVRWQVAPKNGAKIKASYLIQGGEVLWVQAPAARPQAVAGEAIALSILHEDAALVAVNKPAGLVVHPGAGVVSGTLANALVGRYGALAGAAADRPGIVHRLDRETSGVIVAARTESALRKLMAQFEARTVRKMYLALVAGAPADEFAVEAAIGRHPTQRLKMTIVPRQQGRGARTECRTLMRFTATGAGRANAAAAGYALVACYPKTGRTHQLRVHLKSVDCPIVADGLYCGADRWPADRNLPAVIARQALHAYRLELDHPTDGRRMTLVAPVAADLAAALDALCQAGGGDWRAAVEAEVGC